MINIGDMNKKIEIYGFGWDKDELGQKIRKEKLIARVWAKVRLIRSSESIKLLKNEATEEISEKRSNGRNAIYDQISKRN